MKQKIQNIFLLSGLLLVLSLFLISLLKNISYPLLWNDEAETAMYAQRVLRFGYPKIHDAKNIINLIEHPDNNFGITKGIDAYKEAIWGQYYFAVPAIYFAQKVDDFYLKTALIRIPFALIGFFGLVIIAHTITIIFNKKFHKLLFFFLFFFIELLSVSLVLHLRDARYPSLLIFLTGCILYIYFQFYYLKKINFYIYTGLFVFLLFLVFNSFCPLYFPFIITFGLDILLRKIIFNKKRRFITILKLVMPLLISLLITYPLCIFFEVFFVSSKFAQYYHFNFHIYIEHILYILRFFRKYEFLYLALGVKLILIVLLLKIKNKYSNYINRQIQASWILSLLFIVNSLFIASSPLLYERYFINLQPILTTIYLLDIFIICELFPKNSKSLILLFFIIFLINGLDRVHKINSLKGHIYELKYQYKGPLDFAIPFINKQYKNPRDLIIATNYEELSYMYYLDSRVIVGQKGNNLENDLKLQPDIIIQRKGWLGFNPEAYSYLLKKAEYKKISFPVYDYQVNNIPELYYPIFHQFKTKFPEKADEALDIYLK